MTRAPGTPASPSMEFTPSTQAPATEAVPAPVAEPALVDGVDVDAVARAVRACAGVADLHSGRFGEVGTYLPGRRIGGVQVGDTAVTVHIRARWGYSTQDLFTQVSAVTTGLRSGRRLELAVDDIDDDLTGAAGLAVAPPLAIEPPPPAATMTSSNQSPSESSPL